MPNIYGSDNLDVTRTIREKANYSWQVTFPNLPDSTIGYVLLAGELRQEGFNHDLFILKIKGNFTGANRLVSGDPVKLEWTSQGASAVWLGYVYSLENTVKTSAFITTVVCIGTSYFMKESNQSVYTDVSSDHVARDFANKYGFKINSSKHPYVYPMLSQAGQSDWQFLTRLAKQSGFGFRVDNDTLVFKSHLELFNESKESAPYFKYLEQPMSSLTPFMTLFDFKQIISEQSPEIEGTNILRKISTVSVGNGYLSTKHEKKYSDYDMGSDVSRNVREDNTPIFSKIITDEVALSPEHSKIILESKSNSERYRYRGVASLLGIPSVKPYKAIYLDGLNNGMSGFWTVMSVRHFFGEIKPYYMEVEVGTDTLGDTYTSNKTPVSLRNISAELAGVPEATFEYSLQNSQVFWGVGPSQETEVKNRQKAKTVSYDTRMYETLVPKFDHLPKTPRWRFV